MRHALYRAAAVVTAAGLWAGGPTARGQVFETYPVPGEPAEKVPIPTGNPGTHGFYSFFEFVYLAQSWTLGEQTVAVRGLLDSTGRVTGVPGGFVGSGREALNTDDIGRRTFTPGFNIGVGYKTDEGVSVYASYLHTFDAKYNAAATLVPPFFRSGVDLADTFLTAGVFNFPPQYAGPTPKTVLEQGPPTVFVPPGTNPPPVTTAGAPDPNRLFYGIWNGASDMVIAYTTRFNHAQIAARVPLFQTEYSRVYGLAGGRFDWFFERFEWRTIAYDINGNAGPRDAASYENSLSQRMYGPFVGCGHEVYVGKRFSVSTDVTAAGLLNIVKSRAKYELNDESIQNKRSRNDYTVVPSVTAHAHLWWYPLEGVQMRVGYNAFTYFNTRNMDHPIGFNYGQIDPVYETQGFRIVHGLNVGLGLFF